MSAIKRLDFDANDAQATTQGYCNGEEIRYIEHGVQVSLPSF
jgi:hypothetical protein